MSLQPSLLRKAFLLVGLCSSLGLGLSLSACLSSQVEYVPCSSNTDCRSAFGRGWTCEESGLCAEAPIPSRCTSYPEGVLTNLPEYEDWILLGSIFDNSDFEIMTKAARLAVVNVNTRDGLDGTPYGIVECNNESNVVYDGLDTNEATAAVGTYLADALGLPTIIGPATSTRTEVAYNNDSPFGTLHITPSGTSPSLTALDGTISTDEEPGLLWRTAPPDSLQGAVIAEELRALGASRVGIVAKVGTYPESLAAVFQQHWDNGNLSSRLELYNEVGDLGPLITLFDAPEYDAVLVISPISSEMAAFLNGASASEFNYADKKAIFLPDAAYNVQVLDEAAPAISLFPTIRGTIPSTPSGLAYNNFVAAYRAQYNGEDPSDFGFSAHAYDAAWMAIAGSVWSRYQEGEISGLGTARGLRKLSDPQGQVYDLSQNQWSLISSSLREGTSLDVSGASGPLNYDLSTGEMTSPIDVWTIECSGPQVSTCVISPIYCVDLSESPAEGCCTDPSLGCEPPTL